MLYYMSWTVYRHITPDGKIYVGCTGKKTEKRWNKGLGYNKNTPFGKAIEYFGWDNIKHEILDTDLDEFEAKCLEEYYIFSLRTFVGFSDCNGYNCTLGGDGAIGRPAWNKDKHMTEEFKSKISASLIGNQRGKGKHHSEEHKRKISEFMKGNQYRKGKTSPIKGKHRVIIDGKIHYE